MEDQKQTSFTFVIDNFSDKEALVKSPKFSSGGCEWFVKVYPKGKYIDDHLSLVLHVANPESLRLGWKRRASYSFFLLNQSGKDLNKLNDSTCHLFCAQFPGWGMPKAMPLKKLQEKGFMEKNKLIVKVEVKVVEVVDEEDVTGNETLYYNGFQVPYSQVVSVSSIFAEHPDIAVNVRQKNQRVKTTYMNILLDLIETLNKPPHSISENELSNARSELIDLTEAGFKLDWLKTKLDEVSLERKKKNAADGSRVQELEEHIKNLKVELNEEKIKTATVSDFKVELSDLKDELNKEKDKSDTCAAKVLSLEQTVLNLKDQVSELKEELNKNEAQSDTGAAKVLTLEQTVLNLKAELNKEKDKSDTCAAKFLSLEQTVLNLKAELNKEKGVVSSWEVLDYTDVHNEK